MLFTDSVFYYDNRLHTAIETGPFLGQFKDELDGQSILLFIAAGPKMYAYVRDDGKEEYRAKGKISHLIANPVVPPFFPTGITMNRRNAKLFNVEKLKQILAEPTTARHVFRAWPAWSRRSRCRP